jgi:hypothetical protein
MRKYRYEVWEDDKVINRITVDSREELKKCIDAMAQFDKGEVIFKAEVKVSKTEEKKEYELTKEQEEKWAKEKLTEGQRRFLQRVEYGGDIDTLSKLEAYRIIEQKKKEKQKNEEETVYY